jgi:hypothetical protein
MICKPLDLLALVELAKVRVAGVAVGLTKEVLGVCVKSVMFGMLTVLDVEITLDVEIKLCVALVTFANGVGVRSRGEGLGLGLGLGLGVGVGVLVGVLQL